MAIIIVATASPSGRKPPGTYNENMPVLPPCYPSLSLRVLGAAFVLALCTALPLAGRAQEEVRHYEVEMIIFASNDPRAAEGETWAPPAKLRYPEPLQRLQEAPSGTEEEQGAPPDAALESPATAAGLQPLYLLDPGEGSIGEIAQTLENTGYYRILLQWRWIQPITVGGENPHLLVRGGREYGAHRELEGFLRLNHNRYLHLNADLWFSSYGTPGAKPQAPLPPPVPPPWPPETGAFEKKSWNIAESLDQGVQEEQAPVLRTVRLKQHRRMRSQELHYLDHPLFGLLIKLNPYDQARQTP